MIIDYEDVTEPGSKIHKLRLEDLCVEIAKLKALKAMDSISSKTIIQLLSVLDKIIGDGAKVNNFRGSFRGWASLVNKRKGHKALEPRTKEAERV
ncbi:hypothetical protein J6590_033217 [Homalodisca vitripennis]|nr:hypothetical protein J6590_033217 [Homalodisca vitripennis]